METYRRTNDEGSRNRITQIVVSIRVRKPGLLGHVARGIQSSARHRCCPDSPDLQPRILKPKPWMYDGKLRSLQPIRRQCIQRCCHQSNSSLQCRLSSGQNGTQQYRTTRNRRLSPRALSHDMWKQSRGNWSLDYLSMFSETPNLSRKVRDMYIVRWEMDRRDTR